VNFAALLQSIGTDGQLFSLPVHGRPLETQRILASDTAASHQQMIRNRTAIL